MNRVPGTSGKYGLLTVVDLRKLAELKLGQVGAGLDPGPLPGTAWAIGTSKPRLSINPLKASGRRMRLIRPPFS